MTLILTAACPKGIVMAADSAVTGIGGGGITVLSNFRKIVMVPRLGLGISVAGTLNIGGPGSIEWITEWIWKFCEDLSVAKNATELGHELAEVLSEDSQPEDNYVLQLACWYRTHSMGEDDFPLPMVGRVAKVGDQYLFDRVLSADDAKNMRDYSLGLSDKFWIAIQSDGLPMGFQDWVAKEGTKTFSRLIGRPVPAPEIGSVLAYVRFLIRMVADLHGMTEGPPVVSGPIHHLVMLPERRNMMYSPN